MDIKEKLEIKSLGVKANIYLKRPPTIHFKHVMRWTPHLPAQKWTRLQLRSKAFISFQFYLDFMFKILLIVKIYCLDKSTQVYTLYVDIKFVLAIEEFCMRL